MLNNIFCFAGGMVMAISKPTGLWQLLLLGRLIIGFNCGKRFGVNFIFITTSFLLGLNSGLAPVYLTEIAPVNLRGLLGSANQLMVTVAILVASILGLPYLLGTEALWPLVLGKSMQILFRTF